MNKSDLTGKRFDNFTVWFRGDQETDEGGRKRNFWVCKCDCGNIRFCKQDNLIAGTHKSCGCKIKSKIIDLTGKKFNKLTVKEILFIRDGKAIWECVCDCGKLVKVCSYDLTHNKQKSCRCYKQRNRIADKIYKRQDRGYIILNINGKDIREHRYVMEKQLGRKLHKGESVHHKNSLRWDNNLENLELWCKQQPTGARVSDLVDWAKQLLKIYSPESLVVK